MKHWLLALSVAVAGLGLVSVSVDAEAKRLGGGRAAGMQRQAPPAKPADATPAQTPGAAPSANPGMAAAPAAAGTAAAAGKRSWLGPVAGIAAGLGLAALASHFGFGGELANFMTMLLLGVVAIFVVRWLMRRFAGGGAGQPRLAGAGAPFGGTAPRNEPAGLAPQATARTGLAPAPAAASGSAAFPAGMDEAEFTRIAKMIFIRLQAANDAANVDDLRKFTTPELFASLRLDLQERGAATQQTDVVQLEAQVVDAAQETERSVVSVRFTGLIREESSGGAQPFDETWHLVRPLDGSREWAIAGIQPNA